MVLHKSYLFNLFVIVLFSFFNSSRSQADSNQRSLPVRFQTEIQVSELDTSYLSICTNLQDSDLIVFPEDKLCFEIESDYENSTFFGGKLRLRGEVFSSYYKLEIKNFKFNIVNHEDQSVQPLVIEDTVLDTKLNLGYLNQKGYAQFNLPRDIGTVLVQIQFNIQLLGSEEREKHALGHKDFIYKPEYNSKSTIQQVFELDGLGEICALKGGYVYCWGKEYVIGKALLLRDFREKLIVSESMQLNLDDPVVYYTSYSSSSTNPDRKICFYTIAVATENQHCFGTATLMKLISQDILDQIGIAHINEPQKLDFGMGNLKITAMDRDRNITCFVFETAKIKCLGRSEYGILGQGEVDNGPKITMLNVKETVPIELGLEGDQITQFVLSEWVACGLLKSGFMKCWGPNFSGILGLDDPFDNNTTRSEKGLVKLNYMNLGPDRIYKFSEINKYNYTTYCAHYYNGNLKCWGTNRYNILGQTSFIDSKNDSLYTENRFRFTLNQIEQFDYIKMDKSPFFIEKTVFTSKTICVLTSEAKVKCLGDLTYDSKPSTDPHLREYLDFKTDSKVIDLVEYATSSFCALFEDGTVKCWGDYFGTQLRQNDFFDGVKVTVEQAKFISFGQNNKVDSINAYSGNICVTLNNKTKVHCWGKGFPVSSSFDFGDEKIQEVFISYDLGVVVLLESGEVRALRDSFKKVNYESNVPVLSLVKTWLYGVECVELRDHSLECWSEGKTEKVKDRTPGHIVFPEE